jgi:hypothetical protein
MRPLKWAIIIGIGVLAIVVLSTWQQGFSEADLNAMKVSIKSEFEKREGVVVKDVVMMKESSNKAVGFVKISVPILGDVTKSCSATMDEGGKNYIWRCD